MTTSHRSYPPGALKRLQETELDIMMAIDKVCREHGITYFIEGGTSLGAIRHGGFIPWDDDIDLGMSYDNYLKFKQVAPDALPEGYSAHDSTNTDNFPELWIKVFRDGTRFMDEEHVKANNVQGIFVDIFPWVQLSADPADAVRQRRRATFWQRMSYLHFMDDPKIPKDTPFRPLMELGCKVAHRTVAQMFTPAQILRNFEQACEGTHDGPLWMNACFEYSDLLKDEEMFPVRDIAFEGVMVPAPNDCDAYLRKAYGDYMKLPPENERYTHLPQILDFGDGINVMEGWTQPRSAKSPAGAEREEGHEENLAIPTGSVGTHAPKVSVIMSIFQPNRQYLAEQLDTIDAQDFEDMEVVVYNDCPDDPDWEGFCRKHCTRHALRYIQGEKNLGYVKAFERLVGLAHGTYLAFADQDDRWLPGRISAGVKMLDAGYLLVSCDRQIIDGEGKVSNPSWRASHQDDPSLTWHSGEHFAGRAAFTCYSLGMATMIRADIARGLAPYPICTGHDKWLALGANTLGPCANIETPLVQYRQHGDNVTGTMHGIKTKDDWRRHRTEDTLSLAQEYARRFPDSPDTAAIMGFATARMDGSIARIWKYRNLAPRVAAFEIAMHLTPDPLFPALIRAARN